MQRNYREGTGVLINHRTGLLSSAWYYSNSPRLPYYLLGA